MFNYYRRQLKPIVIRFTESDQTSDVQKDKILELIRQSFDLIDNVLKYNRETISFYQEVKISLKDTLKFLKQLESVGWSTGRYLHRFGFHPLFLPEDVWYDLGSIKVEQALEWVEDYITETVNFTNEQEQEKANKKKKKAKIRARRYE